MSVVKGILTLCLVFVFLSPSTGNPCETGEDEEYPDVSDHYVYTDSSQTKHCFFLLEEEVADKTWTYHEIDIGDGIRKVRLVNKTKLREVCALYYARLPILSDKDIFQFLVNTASKELRNGFVPMGVKIRGINGFEVDLEWDDGVKTKVNSMAVYGNSDWKWPSPKAGRLITMGTNGGWESGDWVSLVHKFYLICHIKPDRPISTLTTLVATTATVAVVTNSTVVVTSTAQSKTAKSVATTSNYIATTTTTNTESIASSTTAMTSSLTSVSDSGVQSTATASTQTLTKSLKSTTDSDLDNRSTVSTVSETTIKKGASTTTLIAFTTSSPQSATESELVSKSSDNARNNTIDSTTRRVATTSAASTAYLTTMKLPTTNNLDIKGKPTPSSAHALGKVILKPIFALLLCPLYFCVNSF